MTKKLNSIDTRYSFYEIDQSSVLYVVDSKLPLMTKCFCIIDKTNAPIFTYFDNEEDMLNYQFSVHSSLDIVEEKLREKTAPPKELGHLCSTENSEIYGYMTFTNDKFIVLLEPHFSYRENASKLSSFFSNIHILLNQTRANPFFEGIQQNDQFSEKVREYLTMLDNRI